MENIINSYIGVGKVVFGMSSCEVHQVLGDFFQKYDNIYTCGFKECYSEMIIHYDAEGLCQAIEGNSAANFIYEDIEIVDKPFNKICKIFKSLDDNLIIDDTGFISTKLGIGVYAPTLKKSKKELIQGVIVFKKGYYR